MSVGSIKMSVLTPDLFIAENKEGTWMLMDGSDCSGTDYQNLTNNSEVPDASGCFFSGALDTSGTISEHDTRANDLSLEFDSAEITVNHSHHHCWVTQGVQGSVESNAHVGEIQSQSDSNMATTIKGTTTVANSGNTEDGSVDLSIPASEMLKDYVITSDPETAPKNTSLYFYIKVGE